MKLQINEQSLIDVDPAQRYQITNIDVSPGEQYQFEAKGTWQDASQPCGPDGWHNWWTGYILRFSRLPNYDLFFLGVFVCYGPFAPEQCLPLRNSVGWVLRILRAAFTTL